MKLNRIACTAALSLLFGFIAPAPCLQSQQGEKHERVQGEESKQTQAEARHQQPPQELRQFHLSLKPSLQAKPQPPINDNPQQQDERGDRGQRERTQQQQQFPDKSRDGGNRDRWEHERPGYYRHDHPNDWQGRRARDWRSDHRTWEQRGGYHGYRIPEYRFGQYCGPSHFFRIRDLPVLAISSFTNRFASWRGRAAANGP